MEYRVRKHRERRPASWLTLECPRHVAAAVRDGKILETGSAAELEARWKPAARRDLGLSLIHKMCIRDSHLSGHL